MTPYISLDVPAYDGRGDHRLGTLTCWSTVQRVTGPPYPFPDVGEHGVGQLIFPVFTRASYDDAAAHDNPTADPTRPYGHLPRGVFKVGQPIWQGVNVDRFDWDEASEDHDGMIEKYGWGKMGPVLIPLLPVGRDDVDDYEDVFRPDNPPSYQAWDCFRLRQRDDRLGPTPRSGLGLHGGPLDSEGRLRCTYGCGRLFDDDVVQVAKWVERVLPTVDDLYVIVRGMI